MISLHVEFISKPVEREAGKGYGDAAAALPPPSFPSSPSSHACYAASNIYYGDCNQFCIDMIVSPFNMGQ